MTRSNQKKQKQKQRKLRQRKAKEQKKIAHSASIEIPEPSAKVARKLYEIYEWLEDDDVDQAVDLLKALVKSSPKSAAVAETEVSVYQQLGDHQRTGSAARRFVELVPQNPEAMFGIAHAALFCSRTSVALIHYRQFLDRWPKHELADRAREIAEICESESRRRVSVANEHGGLELDFENGGLEFYERHEESLERLADNKLAEAIALLEQNIKEQPRFMSSRNNLVICQFYQGDLEDAVRTARETCELAPENRFAQASLIKIEFLSGNPEKANELADTAIADPSNEQDAFIALVEALSYLGRDEDLIVLSQKLEHVAPLDDDKKSELLHLFAVANFRCGDVDEAKRLWHESLDIHPHSDALENLDDVEMNVGHAAWSQHLNKWLPRPVMKEMIKRYEEDDSPCAGSLASGNPVVATVVPALLDRGDPTGREFALNFATADATPPMLAALMDFAFGTRGPDALRHKALTTLKEKSVLGSGPHRFFSRGNWTKIKLAGFEITCEPDDVEPWRSVLLEQGYWAMRDGDLVVAEETFQQVLDRDPSCRSARFNLAGVWQQRRHGDEEEKAELEIRSIHADHPEYTFAALSVAIFEAGGGNKELSQELMRGVLERPTLHISEAMMLFSTQIQVALIEDDLESAESSWNMMCQIADENDSRVIQLREKIDLYRLRPMSDRGQTKSILGLS